MKDILVDNCIAKNFCNPLDEEYKRFIKWLFHEGSLVITQQLLREYHSACADARSLTNIIAIVELQQRDGRLNTVSSHRLKMFRFRKKDERRLRSNWKDWSQIKAVLLSNRRFAVSRDHDFCHDINSIPGYGARAASRPQDIPYD